MRRRIDPDALIDYAAIGVSACLIGLVAWGLGVQIGLFL